MSHFSLTTTPVGLPVASPGASAPHLTALQKRLLALMTSQKDKSVAHLSAMSGVVLAMQHPQAVATLSTMTDRLCDRLRRCGLSVGERLPWVPSRFGPLLMQAGGCRLRDPGAPAPLTLSVTVQLEISDVSFGVSETRVSLAYGAMAPFLAAHPFVSTPKWEPPLQMALRLMGFKRSSNEDYCTVFLAYWLNALEQELAEPRVFDEFERVTAEALSR